MEESIGSWIHHQHSDQQSPNSNMLTAPCDLGQSGNIVSKNGTLPMLGPSRVPRGKPSQPYEAGGWFHCLPCFSQGFAPILNSVQKETLPASLNEKCGDLGASVSETGRARKRFLVFDQSGDQTTLVFSSGIGAPISYPTSWLPKPSNAFNLNKEGSGTKRDVINISRPFLSEEFNKQDYEDNEQSEMREDTEELDALLYSDNENYYSQDDEETSTGHSPSTTTGHDKRELFEEIGEEVDSSAWKSKRQKMSDGGYDVLLLMDTASSVKTDTCFKYEDDAESDCSLPDNKSSRKKKIRETISILESIVPDGKGKGKDLIVVIDESIRYLRSLKDKAKALGLDDTL